MCRCVEGARALLLAAAAVAFGCCEADAADPAPGGPAGTSVTGSGRPQEQTDYLIGALDTLRIHVEGQPELSITTVVRPDGRLTIPLVEDMTAAAKTPTQLGREIAERLSTYLHDPIVYVEVLKPVGLFEQQIRVLGGRQPVALAYRAGLTSLDVVTAAGGLPPFAAANAAYIHRQTPQGAIDLPVRFGDIIERGDTSTNRVMQPGDTLVIPEGVFSGQWSAGGSITSQTEYTDNADLDPDGEKRPALIFSVTPGISIRGQSARVNGGLDASVSQQYQAISDTGPNTQVSVLGSSTAELSRDLLFVDASAVVSEQPLSTSANTSTSQENSQNLSTVQAYEVSPYLLNRLGSFANMETRYSFGATIVNGDSGSGNTASANDNDNNDNTVSNSIFNGLGIGLVSGREFTEFGWALRGSVSRTTRFGAGDIDAAGVVASPEYVPTPVFALLSNLGYEALDDGEKRLAGPTMEGGFRWAPSPAFYLRALYGRRLQNNAGEGELRYDIGARTKLVGNFLQSVESGQQSILSNASNLSIDPVTGQFIDRRTGLVFLPRPAVVNINDNLNRVLSSQLTLSHQAGANAFSLSGFVVEQKALDDQEDGSGSGGNGGDTSSYGTVAGYQRQLDQRTAAGLSIGVSFGDGGGSDSNANSSSVTTGEYTRYFASVTLSRVFYQNTTAYIRYGFQKSDAREGDQSYTENNVVVGLSYAFDLWGRSRGG